MTQLTTYLEAKEHNTRLLVGWAKGTYTKKEVLMSCKFLKGLGDVREFKVLQPREQGYKALQDEIELFKYLPPAVIIGKLLEAVRGLAFPLDHKAFKEALR